MYIFISLIAQLKVLFLFGLYLSVYIYVLGKEKKKTLNLTLKLCTTSY